MEGLLLLVFNGPKDANKGQALNTVQHHDMHHRCVYSLYQWHELTQLA